MHKDKTWLRHPGGPQDSDYLFGFRIDWTGDNRLGQEASGRKKSCMKLYEVVWRWDSRGISVDGHYNKHVTMGIESRVQCIINTWAEHLDHQPHRSTENRTGQTMPDTDNFIFVMDLMDLMDLLDLHVRFLALAQSCPVAMTVRRQGLCLLVPDFLEPRTWCHSWMAQREVSVWDWLLSNGGLTWTCAPEYYFWRS